jgi:hypothetical protein
MGLSIHAPPPVLEKPRMPKFKVEEANSADVNGEEDRPIPSRDPKATDGLDAYTSTVRCSG